MKKILMVTFTMFLALIIWATLQKSIAESAAWFIQDPWGIVTLVDLYIGFLLFVIFIHIFEKTLWKTAVWAFLIATLGNLTSLIYIILNYKKIIDVVKKV